VLISLRRHDYSTHRHPIHASVRRTKWLSAAAICPGYRSCLSCPAITWHLGRLLSSIRVEERVLRSDVVPHRDLSWSSLTLLNTVMSPPARFTTTLPLNLSLSRPQSHPVQLPCPGYGPTPHYRATSPGRQDRRPCRQGTIRLSIAKNLAITAFEQFAFVLYQAQARCLAVAFLARCSHRLVVGTTTTIHDDDLWNPGLGDLHHLQRLHDQADGYVLLGSFSLGSVL
jgi:hypothetical protein